MVLRPVICDRGERRFAALNPDARLAEKNTQALADTRDGLNGVSLGWSGLTYFLALIAKTIMSTALTPTRFSFTQAKSLVKDLMQPSPRVYWADFLLTVLTGHVLFFLQYRAADWLHAPAPLFWGGRIAMFVAVAVLYMRASIFIHELVHLRPNTFRGFRVAWNLLCGIPFLIPSFMYYPHIDHHRRKSYGTEHDGEYVELSHRHPIHIVGFILAAFLVPPLAFFRFLVLTPLAWAWPSLREWVEKHASSMVIDIFYLRPDFGPKARRMMLFQEGLCCAWCGFLVLRGPLVEGTLFTPFWIHAYLISVSLIMMNNVRTLGAHRWIGDGRELSFEEQLLDSLNYPHRPWITELWGPVGTRYHALHHLFPSMPYHNLGEAHRRLMAGLPADSMYRETERLTLTSAILELWRRAADNQSLVPLQQEGPQRDLPLRLRAAGGESDSA
jgi:fatty acid desaturase